MVHTFDPSDDFEPGFFEALGRLVAEFGRLEYIMKVAVKRLRGEKFDEGMLYAEEQLRHLDPLGEEAKKFFCERVDDPSRVAEFERQVNDAVDKWEERNDCVHCFWTALDDHSPKRYRPKLEGPKKMKKLRWSRGRVVPVQELRALADRAAAVWKFIDAETERIPHRSPEPKI